MSKGATEIAAEILIAAIEGKAIKFPDTSTTKPADTAKHLGEAYRIILNHVKGQPTA